MVSVSLFQKEWWRVKSVSTHAISENVVLVSFSLDVNFLAQSLQEHNKDYLLQQVYSVFTQGKQQAWEVSFTQICCWKQKYPIDALRHHFFDFQFQLPAHVCMSWIVAVLAIYQHAALDFCANWEDNSSVSKEWMPSFIFFNICSGCLRSVV